MLSAIAATRSRSSGADAGDSVCGSLSGSSPAEDPNPTRSSTEPENSFPLSSVLGSAISSIAGLIR
jgi:hypothetical protein